VDACSPVSTNGDQGGLFATTRWSVVIAAQDRRSAQEALNWLCERYWFPLYAAARGRGASPHDAEDLVQGFFADLLGRNALAAADAARGRFRAFLLTSFSHFVSDQRRAAESQKRGGGRTFVPIDEAVAEARYQREFAENWTPEHDFDRAWALTLIDRALEHLRAECEAQGDLARFDVAQSFLTGDRADASLADAAARLGLSLPAIKSLIHRMRQRFRATILDEIRQTVATEEEVATEQQHLIAALAR
jgi:DNA-directed RNA polymerase specialized sigma24 family protein